MERMESSSTMERRRRIHEQIRLTKLNKLTVKQGDQNVTLNLKVDLLDPAVPIADKVLGMLETYVSKQQSTLQPPAPLPSPQTPQTPPLIPGPKEPVKETIQVVDSAGEVVDQFLCRLCRLKCQTERSLYEHVSRIHGGKSGAARADCDSNDEADESSAGAAMGDEDEPAGVGGAKARHQAQKRLNVAIRVAKVAYLNSKLDTAATNKSSTPPDLLFPNGFRGNFFSQERLPLRSCRIKMKLGELPEPPTDSAALREALETCLVARAELVSTRSLERNISEAVLAARPARALPSEREMRDFFRSLIAYVPLGADPPRLGDLLKRHEASPCLDSAVKVDLLRRLHALVLDAKQLGATFVELRRRLPEADVELVRAQLGLLVAESLVLAVGVVERVYVAFEFKEHWVIKSYKNLKGRGSSGSRADSADSDSEPETTTTNSAPPEEKRTRRSAAPADTTTLTSTGGQFKQVCLVPRPWRYIDGLLNRPVLKKMLESLVLYLKSSPGATLESLSAHFSPALQPVMTLELVEMLERLSCVERTVLSAARDCDLFSDFTNGSRRPASQEDGGETTSCFTCTQEAVFILKRLFPANE